MGLFEDLLFPLAAGAVAGIVATVAGATAATATAIGVIAAGTAAVLEDDLWEKINKYLCSLRDKTLKWLDSHSSFEASVLRFTVETLDTGRRQLNRVLKAKAINAKEEQCVIFEHKLTSKEIEEMGITEDMEETVQVPDMVLST